MAKKSDLVGRIHIGLNYLSQEDINDSVNLVFDYIKTELTKQNRIEIRGFGSFSVKTRKYPKSENTYKTIYWRMSKS